MDDLMLIIGVAGMFLLRIGIPVLLLIMLGILIDRWQTKRENDVRQFQDRYYSDRRYEPSAANDAEKPLPSESQQVTERKRIEQH